MIFKANDKYAGSLSSGYTVGDNTFYVTAVPINVPTIIVAAKGTADETVFTVTSSTINTLIGVARLKGANVNLDAGTTLTCLNNAEFINQFVSISSWVTKSYGATVTFDLDEGAKQRVVLAGNPTLALANVSSAKVFHLRITQSSSGGNTVTWWSGISWDDGVVPTLSTGANKTDTFLFIETSPGYYDGYVTGQNK